MTWDRSAEYQCESDKIAHLVVPYTRGKCLDLGCGTRKVWPHLIGVDNGATFTQTDFAVKSDISDLSLFADNSCDGVYSSHALEDFPEERVPEILREWTRVIKPGGYLTLYVPSANLYPLVGEDGANPAHKWNIYPGDIERHLADSTTCGWTQLEGEERDQTSEYSLFLVFQKRSDGKWIDRIWKRNPEGKKRVLVIRFGAIGDQILVSSILPLLKKDGFWITYNTTPDGQEILQHDPHIDEWAIQDKDQVPNAQLGAWWEALRMENRYDRIVNLSESIEGTLLALPGRINHSYPDQARRKTMGSVNYCEYTHRLAGVSDAAKDINPRFTLGPGELKWAKDKKRELAGSAPVIVWAINGSSPHKVWPWTHIVTSWLVEKTDCHVVLLAGPGIGQQLMDGMMEVMEKSGTDLSKVHAFAGQWKIREALSFAQVADCVVGPETGTLNAVAMEAVPKVIYLSHSSNENLTKHWRNTTVLEPDGVKCYPCNRLHYTWQHCFQDSKTNAAVCASRISPERVFDAIVTAIGVRKAA